MTPAEHAALAAQIETAYRAAHGTRFDAWSPARVAQWCAAQVAGRRDEVTLAIWVDALAWDAHYDAESRARAGS